MSQSTAQICLNGHPTNRNVTAFPDQNKACCPICGTPTVTQCPACLHPIRGQALGHYGDYIPPAYCESCGAPFPWTARRLQAAKDLIDMELVDADDKQTLRENVEELGKESPQTEISARRFKKALDKAGPTVANAIRDVLVNIVSKTAKKIIWHP